MASVLATGRYDGREVDTFFTPGPTVQQAKADAKYYASSRKAQGMAPHGTRYTYKVVNREERKNRGRKVKGRSTTLRNMASVTIQKLPNGVVKITGRKIGSRRRKR